MISSALLRTVMNYGPVINDTWLRQPTDRESGTNWFQTMCKSVDGCFVVPPDKLIFFAG